MHHRSSSAPISGMLTNHPHSDILILSGHLNRPYPTPTLCGFHLGFGLGQLYWLVHRDVKGFNAPSTVQYGFKHEDVWLDR